MYGIPSTAPPEQQPRRVPAPMLPGHLTLDEYRRLSWCKATYEARAHLERRHLPADPDAARHLAFGLWLRATGRLDREFTLTQEV